VNGIGYDTWASQLLAANPVAGRAEIDAGTVLGLGSGANPHQWYSPASVRRIAAAITGALTRLDPAGATYFAARRRAFESLLLRPYDRLLAAIRRRFADVPVGYSESIFAPLGSALGLELLTPPGFAKAIAEGTDVSAGDEATVERQAGEHQIAVWVFNSQNVTPDVQRATAEARAANIPVVTITETLSPASDSFEQWQVAQLRRLRAALHAATGR
jgi:zinc/manganese transport system substrate-binding protein